MSSSLEKLIRAITDAVNTASSLIAQQHSLNIKQYFDVSGDSYIPKTMDIKRPSDGKVQSFSTMGLVYQDPIVLEKMEVNLVVDIDGVISGDIKECPITLTDEEIASTKITLSKSGIFNKKKANVTMCFVRNNTVEYTQRLQEFING